MDQTWSASYGGELVPHDISIYWIDIECEPKIDCEKCLNQHWITSKMDIEWQKLPKIGLIFKILNNILMKFMQKL